MSQAQNPGVVKELGTGPRGEGSTGGGVHGGRGPRGSSKKLTWNRSKILGGEGIIENLEVGGMFDLLFQRLFSAKFDLQEFHY